MGSRTIKNRTENTSYNQLDMTDDQKKQLSNYFNNLSDDRKQWIDNYNQWSNPSEGSIQDYLRKRAMGNNLGYVNPYEQQMLNDNINQRNLAIQRAVDASGRNGSFDNYKAIADNTDMMRNQFMANTINRNRAEQQSALLQYLNGLANSVGRQDSIDMGLPSILRQYINSHTDNVNETMQKRSNLNSILGGIGSIIPIFGGIFK